MFHQEVNISSTYFSIYSQEMAKNIAHSLRSFMFLSRVVQPDKVHSAYATEYPEQKMNVNGIKINYAKAGTGPILVLVHGWANNWISWVPVANYLRQHYTVYLIDLPGFGDSDNLPEYSVELAAKCVIGFVKKLPAKPAALIGLSMGSMVVAEAGKINSTIVKNLILMGPVIKNGNLKNIVSHTVESSLKIINNFPVSQIFLKKIIETRVAAYSMSKYINMYKFNKFLVDEYGMIGKKKMRREAFVQMGYTGASYDLNNTLTDYQLPVLLIYGKEDKISSPVFVKKTLLKQNRRIQLKVIPEAGHVVPLEQPRKVATSIDQYLKKVSKN